MAMGNQVELEDLPDVIVRGPRNRAQPPQDAAEHSKRYPDLEAILDPDVRLRRALELAEGHRDRTAAMLGMSRTSLWRRMRALSLLDD